MARTGSKNLSKDEVNQIQKYILEGFTTEEIMHLTNRSRASIYRVKCKFSNSQTNDIIEEDSSSNVKISEELKERSESAYSISMEDSDRWNKLDIDHIEIPKSYIINNTVSPEEAKDIAALYDAKLESISKEKEDIYDILFDLGYNRVRIGKIPFNCGLFDRHDMPVKNFIFKKQTLSSRELFDFDYQKNEIIKFFRNFNIDNNRVLNVYLSGCQQGVGSVVQVCMERKIDLSFFHFNKFATGDNKWVKQEILKFDNDDCVLNNYVNYTQPLDKENLNMFKSRFFDESNEFCAIEINIDTKTEIEILANKEDGKKILFSLCRNEKIIDLSNNLIAFKLFNVKYDGKTFSKEILATFTC